MNGWLLFLVLFTMPYRMQYWPVVASTQVEWNNWRCRGGARACYYDDTMYLKSDWQGVERIDGLRHAANHEMQHRMQGLTRIWETPGGWPEFERLVSELIDSGQLDQSQTETLSGLMRDSQAHELHAELPLVLNGHLPSQFAPWYPWFVTE